jgi:citrate synthase
VTDGTRGLEGIIAAVSAVSSIVGDTLTYRGYDVEDLAGHSTFEEVTYLLWNGDLPTADNLGRFAQRLRSSRDLPPFVTDMLGRLRSDAEPMAALRTLVSGLSLDELPEAGSAREANILRAVNLVAGLPVAIARLYRARLGEEPIGADSELDECSNFLSMMFGTQPSQVQARALEVALIAHADHELNASTFAARVAASTLADLYGAVVAALATLAGPLHGGAAAAVMRMLEEVDGERDVDSYLDDRLERRLRIAGFGHRVYTAGDPRARILKSLSAELAEEAGNRHWYEMSVALQDAMKFKSGLLPNVDFYAASVYTYLGVPPYLFAPLFAWSRASGWIAHILEQYDNNRLIRPRAEYVGAGPRSYIPIHER